MLQVQCLQHRYKRHCNICMNVKCLSPTFSVTFLSLDNLSLAILGFCPVLRKATHKSESIFGLFLLWIGVLFSSLCFRALAVALQEVLTNSKGVTESCVVNKSSSKEQEE